MHYDLSDLLRTFRTEGAVALHLADGFPPAYALSSKPYDPQLPSAMLFAAEGPALSRSDLVEMMAEITKSGTYSGGGYEPITKPT